MPWAFLLKDMDHVLSEHPNQGFGANVRRLRVARVLFVNPIGHSSAPSVHLNARDDLVPFRQALVARGVQQRHHLRLQELHLHGHRESLVQKPIAAAGEHFPRLQPTAHHQGLLGVQVQHAIGVGLLDEIVKQIDQGGLAGFAFDARESGLDADADQGRGPFLHAGFASPVVAPGVARPIANGLESLQRGVWARGGRVPAGHAAASACGVVARAERLQRFGNRHVGGVLGRWTGAGRWCFRRAPDALAAGAEPGRHQSYPRPAKTA